MIRARASATGVRGFEAQLDAVIDRALEEQRIVGTVVLVSHRGERVYGRAAGLADREAHVPMQEDSIFCSRRLRSQLSRLRQCGSSKRARLDSMSP
jgi:CubicO group peptidase (beta-lactamase class C family)